MIRGQVLGHPYPGWYDTSCRPLRGRHIHLRGTRGISTTVRRYFGVLGCAGAGGRGAPRGLRVEWRFGGQRWGRRLAPTPPPESSSGVSSGAGKARRPPAAPAPRWNRGAGRGASPTRRRTTRASATTPAIPAKRAARQTRATRSIRATLPIPAPTWIPGAWRTPASLPTRAAPWRRAAATPQTAALPRTQAKPVRPKPARRAPRAQGARPPSARTTSSPRRATSSTPVATRHRPRGRRSPWRGPTAGSSRDHVVSVAHSQGFACALRDDHTVWCCWPSSPRRRRGRKHGGADRRRHAHLADQRIRRLRGPDRGGPDVSHGHHLPHDRRRELLRAAVLRRGYRRQGLVLGADPHVGWRRHAPHQQRGVERLLSSPMPRPS